MRAGSVWRVPGMLPLVGMVAAGFSGFALLMPVSPLWATHGGADEAGSGLVTGVLMIFTVLGQLFVPAALRRFGWQRVLVVGLVLLGAPSILHIFSDHLVPILGIAAVRGLGFAVITVCGSSAVAELVEPERRGRAIGAFGLGIAIPQVILLPIAPWVAEHLGYPLVFALALIPLLGIAAAVPLGRRLDALPPHPDPADGADHRIRRYLGLVPPILVLLGITLSAGALLTFVPQFGIDPALAVVGLLLLTGPAALARWAVGHVADRFGAARMLWPFVLIGAGGLALIGWAVASPDRVAAMFVGIALVGTAYGALQNLTLAASFSAVPRRDQVVASAVWNIGYDTGTGIGAIVVGALASAFAFPPAILFSAGLTLITLPLAFVAARRTR